MRVRVPAWHCDVLQKARMIEHIVQALGMLLGHGRSLLALASLFMSTLGEASAVWEWDKHFMLDNAFYEEQLDKGVSSTHSGWVEHQTPKTGQGQWSFYYCETLGWSTWEKPREPYWVAKTAKVEWEEHAFYSRHRKRWCYFYYNRRSGASTWWRPSEAYVPCFEAMPCPFPTRWPPWE